MGNGLLLAVVLLLCGDVRHATKDNRVVFVFIDGESR